MAEMHLEKMFVFIFIGLAVLCVLAMGQVLIIPAIGQSSASDWVDNGMRLYSQGKYFDALQAYDKAIELDPNNARAWHCKCIALTSRGKYDEAIKACDKALELDPKDAKAWATKASALNSLGRNEESIQASEKAIELDPKLAMAWVCKGNALGSQGKNDQAIEAFDKALEIDPKLEMAWLNKGIALGSQNKYDEAIHAYDVAIELDPKDALAWSNKGWALSEQKRYDNASQVLSSAIELDPNSARAWFYKGIVLLNQGKNDDAFEAFSKAAELDPNFAEARTNKIYALNLISKNRTLEILGLDLYAFPKVKVNVFINESCAMAGKLKKDNFKVEEYGTDVAIDDFYFTGNASGQKLDLAIAFDDTRSMQPRIDAMKSKVKALTDKIKTSGLDANYCLVSFKDSISIKTNWTNDPEALKKNVDTLHADGGNDEPEDSLDAIEAVISSGFRPGAQKVILVITDAHAHYRNDSSRSSKYTKEEIENDIKEAGVIFVPVSPTFEKATSYVDLRDIANEIHSKWIDINSGEFLTILEHFKDIITGTYVIDYTSPNPTNFEDRNVTIAVDAPGCVSGSDSISRVRTGITASNINGLKEMLQRG
jgi:tetratricopeptide (TPR) repeat protein